MLGRIILNKSRLADSINCGLTAEIIEINEPLSIMEKSKTNW
jgi:hypothetical protein